MKKFLLAFTFSALVVAIVFAAQTPHTLERIDIVHKEIPKGGLMQAEAQSIIEGPCYGADFWYDFSQGPSVYIINANNPQNIPDNFIYQTFYDSTQVWDDETDTDLFPDYIYIADSLHAGELDGYNVVSFEDLDSNIIALTSFWYWIDTGEIAEWDMAFNTDFVWGDTDLGSGIMDFKNIAVHEMGHTFGLYDLYQPGCSYVTMYGYSSYDETYKRDLAAPDIFILQQLYGGKTESPLNYFGRIKTSVNVNA